MDGDFSENAWNESTLRLLELTEFLRMPIKTKHYLNIRCNCINVLSQVK